MTTGSSEGYAKKQLQQADEFLDDADALLRDSRLKSAVDRAYYAMYHAASALLVQKGITTKTHRGLITQFSKEFVKTGLVSEELGDAFMDTFDARQESTYDVDVVFGEEGVREIIDKAREFVAKAKEISAIIWR